MDLKKYFTFSVLLLCTLLTFGQSKSLRELILDADIIAITEKIPDPFHSDRKEIAVSDHKKIIELDAVTKSFDGTTIVHPFSYTFKKGDRIGIIGKNGVGKSTFLNVITGKLQPDSGDIETDCLLQMAI